MIPVKVGDLLHLKEADYLYGKGELTLRVTVIVDDSSDQWAELRGVEILWNGERAPDERRVWVSVPALRLPRTRTSP